MRRKRNRKALMTEILNDPIPSDAELAEILGEDEKPKQTGVKPIKLDEGEKIKGFLLHQYVSSRIDHKDPMWGLKSVLKGGDFEYFPRVFRAYEEGGARVFVEILENGLTKLVTDDILLHAISAYFNRYARYYIQSATELKKLLAYWKIDTKAIEKPKPFKWQDEEGPAFAVIPFNRYIGASKLPPTWRSIMDRMSNQQAFCLFLGSLIAGVHVQKYVWLFGEGNDGKSAMSRCLKKAFGYTYFGTSVPEGSAERFWFSQLVGRKIIAFNDCSHSMFTKKGVIKSLTGDDSLHVDRKNQDFLELSNDFFMLFLSNEKPKINKTRADLRRLIFCEMRPRTEADHIDNFEMKLWEETGDFLRYCKQLHTDLVVETGSTEILCDEAHELAEDNELLWEKRAKDHFNFGEVSMEKSDFVGICTDVLKMNRYEGADFYRFLEREFGVKTVRKGTGDRSVILTGIAQKIDKPSNLHNPQ